MAAPVVAARTTPGVAAYRVSLSGSESLAWQIRLAPDCVAFQQGADGSGTQTVTLATTRVALARVALARAALARSAVGARATATLARVALARSAVGARATATLALAHPLIVRESWDRTGTLVDDVCSRGPEAASTVGCGVRTVTDRFTLTAGARSELTLRAQRLSAPYGEAPSLCPFAGFTPFLAGLRARLPARPALRHRAFLVRFRWTAGPSSLLWEDPSGDDRGVSGSVTDALAARFTPVRG
ncbi:MAG: hypothetical protein JOZ07_02740 [Solirubrobacterales bacterium]|nr:hypothetical protein [Solirubrobacterales bacterium]